LRIFANRTLDEVVLIDNSVYSFAFQIENGVPIIPFYDDPSDDELYHLITYMKGVYELGESDVRLYNREAFKLIELSAEENDFVLQSSEREECEENDEQDMTIA
jgi:NLI interacting factor-like phosphatase